MRLPFLIILLSAASIIMDAEACRCYPSHPQRDFCTSDWVALVKIKQFNKMDAAYKIELLEIYRATPKAVNALEQNLTVWTDKASCRVNSLEPEEIWVIGGSMEGEEPYFQLCDLHMPWSATTEIQRMGFRMLYEQGCDCHIGSYFDRHIGIIISDKSKECRLDTGSKCQEKFGTCLKAGSHGCTWTRWHRYDDCLKGLEDTERKGR